MKPRWVELENEVGLARYLGGTAVYDILLWNNQVISIQPDNEVYFSFTRGDALLDYYKGERNEITVELKFDTPNGFWTSSINDLTQDDLREVILYLLIFAPEVYSDAVREEIAATLTT